MFLLAYVGVSQFLFEGGIFTYVFIIPSALHRRDFVGSFTPVCKPLGHLTQYSPGLMQVVFF